MTEDDITPYLNNLNADNEGSTRNALHGLPYPLTRGYVINALKKKSITITLRILVENGIDIDSEIALLLFINNVEESVYFWWESKEDIYNNIIEHMSTPEKEKFTTTITLLGIYP